MLQSNDNPEIRLIYLDCPTCGRFKKWGERQHQVAEQNGISFRTVSFAMPEVRQEKLMEKAKKRGIDGFPFFTNGRKFSKELSAFVEAPKRKAPAKKSSKKKVSKNGNTSKVHQG